MDRLTRLSGACACFAFLFSVPAFASFTHNANDPIPVPTARPGVAAPLSVAGIPVPTANPHATVEPVQMASAIPVPTPAPRNDEDDADSDGSDPGDLAGLELPQVSDPADPTIIPSNVSCVPYARERSGIAIYGDARTWWGQADGQYDKLDRPASGAVMVFTPTKRMSRGHVAVVEKVVSAREIRIDHANWGRDGNLYLDMPVIDVSDANDWSEVRVWNARASTWGSHVYRLNGFIAARPVS